MPRQLPEGPLGDEAAHLRAFLGFYRDTVVEKCRSLSVDALVTAAVPSGWSPLALLLHVASVERRWVVWGFLGEPVDDPWIDSGGVPDGAWRVPDGTGLREVVARLLDAAGRTDAVLASTPLETPGAPGGRFMADGPAGPDLRWTCFHVLQEYARHAGQLDVAVELAGGHVGE